MGKAKKNFQLSVEKYDNDWYRILPENEAARKNTHGIPARKRHGALKLIKLPNVFIELQKLMPVSPEMRTEIIGSLTQACLTKPDRVQTALACAQNKEANIRRHHLRPEREDELDRQYGPDTAQLLKQDYNFLHSLPSSYYDTSFYWSDEIPLRENLERITTIIEPGATPETEQELGKFLRRLTDHNLITLTDAVAPEPLYKYTRDQLMSSLNRGTFANTRAPYQGFTVGPYSYLHRSALHLPTRSHEPG